MDKRLFCSAAAVASLLQFGSAHAQAAASATNVVEDVIVTAQRREERLQNVPIAITAVPHSSCSR